MSTAPDQAHNAIERQLFAMKGFHYPGGSQSAFLTGLAQLIQRAILPDTLQVADDHMQLAFVEVENAVELDDAANSVLQLLNPLIRAVELRRRRG